MPKFVPTVVELAVACDVNPSTAYTWLKMAGCPQKTADGFDVEAIAAFARGMQRAAHRQAGRARRRRKVPAAAGDTPAAATVGDSVAPRPLDPEVAAEIRWKEARAERAEIEVKQQRGELVEFAEVKRMLVARAAAFRKDLRGMGRRLARQLVNSPDPAVIQAAIEKAVDGALRHWSADG